MSLSMIVSAVAGVALALGCSAGSTTETCPKHLSSDGGCCSSHEHVASTQPSTQQSDVYTCSMHPEVTSDKPGKCPKCGMDLVKKEKK